MSMMTELESIWLTLRSDVVDLNQLSNAVNLQSVYLAQVDEVVCDKEVLSQCVNLQEFTYVHCNDHKEPLDFSMLGKNTELVYLNLNGNFTIDINELRNLTNLKKVMIDPDEGSGAGSLESLLDKFAELDGSYNREEIVVSMVTLSEKLWNEGSAEFSENNGGEFGGGVKMGYNADMQRLEIFGEENGACAKFNTSLMTCMTDEGMEKTPQQAVLVKFSASDITNVGVSFEALDEITFSFRDDGIYFADVANFLEMPISNFMPNNLELKNDTIYYFFFAFDAEGNIRMFVWEDRLSENQAYFEYDLYQDADDINSCDLIMHLSVGAGEQFNTYEYWVYTFDSFMDGMPYVVANGDI